LTGRTDVVLPGQSSTLAFTDKGIKDFFKDSSSIIYGGSCYSQTLYDNDYTLWKLKGDDYKDGQGYTGNGTGNGPDDEPDYVANARAYGSGGFDLGAVGPGKRPPAETYFGYVHSVPGPAAVANATRFFGELAGRAGAAYGNGADRWATVAFAKGAPWRADSPIESSTKAFKKVPALPPVLTHTAPSDCPKCDANLAPSITSAIPLKWAVKGTAILPGAVQFDTLMDTKVPVASVLSIKTPGCSAALTKEQWTKGGDAITFSFTATTTPNGSVTLQVTAANARAAGNASLLDGNQPSGVSGVGPNQNDYVWTIPC
jgi:hypothetical protein